jgi:hypothetical protein
MEFQGRLGLLPADAGILSETVAVGRSNGTLLFFTPGGPMLRASPDDADQMRLAAVHLLDPAIGGNLKVGVLAEVLGVHRATLHRWRRSFEAQSVAGLVEERRGPKGPHKLRGPVLVQAQCDLDRGVSQSEMARRRAGVTEGTIRAALCQGRLVRRTTVEKATEAGLSGPGRRNQQDQETGTGVGVAVKRLRDRGLARAGALVEAAPCFETAGAVAKAGVLVALPAVAAQGLYEVAHQVYGRLKNGFYGLDAVLSTLVFMALLRIKSPEQLSSHAPGEFGLVLGLDRAPETETVRRKLAELGARGRALELTGAFARRWATEQPELLGFLYVDGHVRPYNGRKYTLPKTHVPRRRLCMPAATDYWVNDALADPLFYVMAPGNEKLLAVLEGAVLPEVRELVGRRRVTLVMDRECWSPARFQDWSERGFDVMTYRKGSYEPWPEVEFAEFVSRDGATRADRYRLAERALVLSNGFEVREVRRLTEGGHQTSIVTTRTDLSILEVAERMFSRCRQENFFRYMCHEFDLDHLPTQAVEAADTERLVPNPARKAKTKEIGAVRRELGRLREAYGKLALGGSGTLQAQGPALQRRIRIQEASLERLRGERKALPSHVPIGTVQDPATVLHLEQERKRLVDQVKMVAYRAETELANLVGPSLGCHHDDEARSFLRQVFQLPADLIPDQKDGTLIVRPHGMANARSNRALGELCQILNGYETRYPGTQLRLVLESPPVA